MRRTGCYGTCPIYTVSIFGDGRVVFEGKRYVAVRGRREAHLSVATVQQLAQDFLEAKFLELKDSYIASVTDNPSTFTTFNYGGQHKTVEDYVAGPPELKRLEAEIDRVSKIVQWICKGDDPRTEICSAVKK